MDNVQDAVCVIDADFRVRYVNRAGRERLGLSDESGSFAALSVVHPQDHERVIAAFADLIERHGDDERIEIRVAHTGGDHVWVEVHAINLVDEPTVGGIACSFRDLTAERELIRQARSDRLTGLANRGVLMRDLELIVADRTRKDREAAVLLVDIDDFRVVNDSLGHTAGDHVLQTIADRFRKLEPEYRVCRFGGDEYVVAAEVDTLEEVHDLADLVIHLVREPVFVHGRHVHLTASVGIAFLSTDVSVEQALSNADLALFSAKRDRRGSHVVFEPAMQDLMTSRFDAVHDLRHALDRGELLLAFQPIVSVQSEMTVLYEALLRWRSADGTIRPAGSFLDEATLGGLLADIDLWVILNGIDQLGRITRAGRGSLPSLAVNISAGSLGHPDLIPTVSDALERAGTAPGRFWVELTEATLAANIDQAAGVLAELRDLGVCVAIDDFGAGHSSMQYLRDLPVDALKIDRSFVNAIDDGSRDALLCKAMMDIGHALGLFVIAEGVERPEQFEILRRLGFDGVQGYLFGRPEVTPLEVLRTLDLTIRVPSTIAAVH